MKPDFVFYSEVYGGTLSEGEFSVAIKRVFPILSYIVMGKEAQGGEAVSLAACAMVDAAGGEPDDGTVITSEKIGTWSKTFEGRSFVARMYEVAKPYLAKTGLLYRGC